MHRCLPSCGSVLQLTVRGNPPSHLSKIGSEVRMSQSPSILRSRPSRGWCTIWTSWTRPHRLSNRISIGQWGSWISFRNWMTHQWQKICSWWKYWVTGLRNMIGWSSCKLPNLSWLPLRPQRSKRWKCFQMRFMRRIGNFWKITGKIYPSQSLLQPQKWRALRESSGRRWFLGNRLPARVCPASNLQRSTC